MPFFSGFHLWLCLMKCKTRHFNIKIVICNQRYIILFSGQTLITTVQLHWCPKAGMPTKYYLPVINSVKFLGKWYCGVKIISMGKHARRGPDYIKKLNGTNCNMEEQAPRVAVSLSGKTRPEQARSVGWGPQGRCHPGQARSRNRSQLSSGYKAAALAFYSSLCGPGANRCKTQLNSQSCLDFCPHLKLPLSHALLGKRSSRCFCGLSSTTGFSQNRGLFGDVDMKQLCQM